MNEYVDISRGLNLTQIWNQYGKDEFNLAPRMHFKGIYFFDQEQEAKMNIGVDWPYPDLTANECVVTQDL